MSLSKFVSFSRYSTEFSPTHSAPIGDGRAAARRELRPGSFCDDTLGISDVVGEFGDHRFFFDPRGGEGAGVCGWLPKIREVRSRLYRGRFLQLKPQTSSILRDLQHYRLLHRPKFTVSVNCRRLFSDLFRKFCKALVLGCEIRHFSH